MVAFRYFMWFDFILNNTIVQWLSTENAYIMKNLFQSVWVNLLSSLRVHSLCCCVTNVGGFSTF